MRALGILAAACFLGIAPAHAQDRSCTLRCTTIYQYFDDQIAATIPLACDAAAIRCAGESALRINGEMVPTAITAEFTPIALELAIVTAQGALEVAPIVFATNAPAQSRTFPLRWSVAPAPGDFRAHRGHAIGGHVRLVVENYERPPPGPPRPARPL